MTELLRVQKRYENPENSMEAFILAGVHATLKAREAENHSLRCSQTNADAPDYKGSWFAPHEICSNP